MWARRLLLLWVWIWARRLLLLSGGTNFVAKGGKLYARHTKYNMSR
jgi:hypothetical protein